MLANSDFTNNILLWFWIITLLYSGFILIFQKHFKRTLAYSSSENMWILALALWIWSPLALKLGILHLIAHSFLKTASFMSAWNILLEQWSWKFEKIWNLIKNQKVSAILLILSLLMLAWIPISPLFISEIWLLITLFSKNIYLTLIVIFAFILIFSWLLINFSKLFKENKDYETKKIKEQFKINSIFSPILLTLIIGICSITSLLFIF
jgi:formate hydrogenlyase subunit 3/multisubunit Na+/H+ antiporter MnhD subunit